MQVKSWWLTVQVKSWWLTAGKDLVVDCAGKEHSETCQTSRDCGDQMNCTTSQAADVNATGLCQCHTGFIPRADGLCGECQCHTGYILQSRRSVW